MVAEIILILLTAGGFVYSKYELKVTWWEMFKIAIGFDRNKILHKKKEDNE